MKLTAPFCLTLVAFVLPTLAHAHPGHDGHELTWDFHVHGMWEISALALVAIASGWFYLRNRTNR